MKSIAIIGTLLLGLGLVFPLAVRSDRAPAAAAAGPKKGGSVVGHLLLQRRKVTLKSDGRVTVRAQDGRVIAEDLTPAELRAVDPALQRMLEKTLQAGKAGTQWAGL